MAGRTGLGAVMGSKNLKAIAVKGSGKVPVFDPAAYAPRRSAANIALKADPMTAVLHHLGTAGAADYFDYLGEQPKKYFSAGTLEGADKLSGASIAETILAGTSACHACVIACGRVVRLEDGAKRKGPEYETLMGFGPNLGITDPGAVTRLGEWCDRYGVDSISMSGTIGLAFRLYELGFSPAGNRRAGTVWGNAAAAEAWHSIWPCGASVRAIPGASCQTAGRTLRRAGGCAVHVNGLEVAYHDPRGASSGMAIVYATARRAAPGHNQRPDYFLADIGQVEASLGLAFYDRHAGAEKAANVARHQDFRTVNNALVLCLFANVPPETMVELVNAACGCDWTLADLLRCGERAWNLKRLLNLKLGLTRESERLPAPLLRPYAEGGSAGYVIPFEEMMQAYYQARGWDAHSGAPTAGETSRTRAGYFPSRQSVKNPVFPTGITHSSTKPSAKRMVTSSAPTANIERRT